MKTALLPILFALGAVATLPAFAGTSGLSVIDTIKVGGDGGWDYAAVDGTTHKLYLSHKTSVASVDLATKTVNANFATADGAHIGLPVQDGAAVLITNGKANTVTLNDAATGAVTATIATDSKPDAALLDAATGNVFVMANDGNKVDVIDLASAKVVANIAVGGAAEGGASDGQGLVFTHLEDKDAIVAIDARAMTVKATYPLNDCPEPSGLAFVAKGRLILSACKNGTARVTNADTGAEVASLAIGQRPDGALYDDKAMLGYIPCGDGTLSVISFAGDTPAVVDVIATKAGARTAALDPTTGYVYLPTADLGPPATPGDRPSILPGTFEVLVVGK